ncbi:MAG TPA: hypothetical protein VGE07_02310 [Herpetosiphonaceae bacterium]
MKELIAQLVEKANLSQEQAQQVADTVKGFLQEKLPAPIWGSVESFLTGDAISGAAEKAKDALGGLFGKG